MDQPNLPQVQSETFAAAVSYQEPVLTVRMTGNWDMHAVAAFDDFVRALQAETDQRAATEVNIHVSGVEFITSSCFKSLVRWVATLRKLTPPPRYRITFHTNTKLAWQKRSLEPLLDLADGRVSIE